MNDIGPEDTGYLKTPRNQYVDVKSQTLPQEYFQSSNFAMLYQ